jgi:hypothetical protein
MNGRAGFLGLALLGSLLLALIVLELGGSGPDEDQTGIVPIRHAPKPPAHVALREPEDHTDSWVATALARPLFSRDRKPTPVVAKSGGGPTLVTLPRLTGVIVGPFGRTAIFAGTDGGKPVVVAEGSTVGPYTVQTIRPEGVKVTGPGGEQLVTLSGDAKTRESLAADIQRLAPPMPGQPQFPPGMPANATQQAAPFNAQLRQNLLNLRQGQPFQRPRQANQGE